jgi:hypothetical protein
LFLQFYWPLVASARNRPPQLSSKPLPPRLQYRQLPRRPRQMFISIPDAIKLLEQIKAANDEVLAKQKAALERLDELQDAADQLRIFVKRG